MTQGWRPFPPTRPTECLVPLPGDNKILFRNAETKTISKNPDTFASAHWNLLLTGKTQNGTPIRGTEAIRVLGCQLLFSNAVGAGEEPSPAPLIERVSKTVLG